MRKFLLAVAAAAILMTGASGYRAEAMTAATPSALGVASAEAGSVQKAAIVCGRWRCVHVWPYWHRPYYWGHPYGYRWHYWHQAMGWHYWHRPWGWGWHHWRHWGWHRHW